MKCRWKLSSFYFLLILTDMLMASFPETVFSAEHKSIPMGVVAQPGGRVGDMHRVSKEEIMARFPMEKHREFMARAIANSYKAGVLYKTGGAFGAVIVDKNGRVLSDGLNHVVGQNDPTWHGEMQAIREACALLKSPKLTGCILYTSSEPCPMCLATAYWAGIDGIIYGATVADSKKYGNFDDDFIYAQLNKPAADRVISEQSLMREEAVKVWKQYSKRKDKIDY